MSEQKAPIIVKRIKKVAGGHHGGAVEDRLCRLRDGDDGVLLLMWVAGFDSQG